MKALRAMLAANSVTGSLGLLGIMVRDREKGVLADFLVSPLRRLTMLWSYMISALFVTFVLNLLAFALMQFFL